jgi:nucleotide-binding universal stress UspA family protein
VFGKVLLAYDGTAEGRHALRQGAEVAMCMKSETYLLAICQSYLATAIPEGVTPELARCEDERAQALLGEGVQWLMDHGVAAEGALEYGNAAARSAEVAERIGADLIVVGHKHRSRLARWWSESDEESLLERVRCSVLVAVSE